MKKYLLFFGVICLIIGSINAFDLPPFYRAPFLQTDAIKSAKDWTTRLNARFAAGKSNRAFNEHEHNTTLFNANGPFDVSRLGLNLENITAKTQTNIYWGTGGHWTSLSSSNKGLVEFTGHFKNTEIDFELTQNLIWGFYLHAYAPYKEVHLDTITFKNVGTSVVNSQDVEQFMTQTLPTILTENGFKTALTDPFKQQDFGDCAVSVGWRKHKGGLSGIIDNLGGCMQIGVLLPTAPRVDQDRVFSVPLGYDRHLGFIARMGGQATLWKLLTLGAQAGSIIFIKETQKLRMLTDKNQNGWIKLERGSALVDQGSLWDIGVYAKADQLTKGFAATIGASLTKQERTVLQVHDDTFLKTARESAATPDANRVVSGYLSVDDIVNTDKQLRGWQTYALHFVAEYDATDVFKTSWAPFIRFEFDYPFCGKLSWTTAMLSGSAGLSISWGF